MSEKIYFMWNLGRNETVIRVYIILYTAWKVSKYGVFFGPYFPVFGLNTEIYGVFSPNAGKYGPEKTPYLDTFHAVIVSRQKVT